MKICPFISHMIGEDHANVLEAKGGPSDEAVVDSGNLEESSVTVLGYDTEGAVGTNKKRKGKGKGKAKADSESRSHLFCLKETCRFYQAEANACQFDAMFELAEAGADESKSYEDAVEKTTASVNKELDKFWKFQTRSVTELISSFGDVEKRQKDSLGELQTELSEKLEALEIKQPEIDLEPFREEIVRLQEALISREDGMEDFSTTLSEIVLNVEEGMKSIGKGQESLAEKFESMDLTEDALTSLREKIESTIEDKLASAVSEISERQKSWEERLEEMSRKQDELTAALKEAPATPEVTEEQPQQRQKDAKKLNNLGVSSFHNGELELAREQFVESIAIDENFAEAHNNLGLVCSELGDEKAASDAFSKAIELDPDLHAAYNNLGYLFYKQNSYDKAVEMYNEALGRQSNNSTAYTNLGNAYYKLGRNEDAQAAWEKALELDPTNEKAGRSLRRLEV